MHAWLAIVQAIQKWPNRRLPGVRAGDAAAGTFADGHYTRGYATLPFTTIGEGTPLVRKPCRGRAAEGGVRRYGRCR